MREHKWWASGDVEDAWTEHDVSREAAHALMDEAADSLARELAGTLDFIDSPIERKLLLALIGGRDGGQHVYVPQERVVRVWNVDGKRPEQPSVSRFLMESSGIDRIAIDCQYAVGPYSADFKVTWDGYGFQGAPQTSIFVEADGHDFHERTKKQAEHDKKRDRYFTAQGLTLLRFTGSEIHRAPDRCALEVFGVLHRLHTTLCRAIFDREHGGAK